MGRRDKPLLFVDFEGINVETHELDPIEWDKPLPVVPETWNGHTPLCVHCGGAINPFTGGTGNWVHEGGRLNCMSSSIAITFATPTKWTDAE
jgi:hypothetical protein